MSTRSFIGIHNQDGSISGIYCHWDGYPTHVGSILKEHYSNEDKLKKLIDLGDISSLGKEIGEKHDWNNPHPDWTVAYARDREDPITIGESYGSLSLANNRLAIGGYDYMYIFSGDKWIFGSIHVDKWIDLNVILRT